MGAIIGIFVIILLVSFVIGIIKASWNDSKSAEMDESGNLHCKQCGCSNFVQSFDRKGNTVMQCAKCGYSWTIFR